MAIESKKVISIETGSAKTSVKDLRNELKELRGTLLSVEEGTEEYTNALQRAGEIQHQFRETQRLITQNSGDLWQNLQNGTNALGGITAGFQAAQATMNLFGIENEDVIKSLQKMQSLMALTQSFAGIHKGIDAFKNLSAMIKGSTIATRGLNAALAANPIGAVIAVVAALAAAFMALKSYQDEVLQKQIDYNKALQDEALSRANELIKDRITLLEKLAKIEGQSDSQIINSKIELQKAIVAFIEANNKYTNAQIADAKRGSEFTKKQLEITRNAFLSTRQALVDFGFTEEEINGLIAGGREELKKQKTALDNLNKSLQTTTILEKARSDADAKKNAKEITEELKIQKDLITKIGILGGDMTWANSLKNGTKEATEELQKYFNLLLQIKSDISWLENLPAGSGPKLELVVDEEEIEDDFTHIINDTQQYIDQLKQAFITPQELYDQDIQNLKNALQLKLISEEEYAELKKKLDDEQAEYSKKKQMEVARTVMNSTAQGLNSMASLFSSIASMIDDSTEKGFEQQKNLQVASATMNMLSGVVAAWNSAMALPAPASFILGALQTAATVAMGIAQIAQIKKQQFNSNSTATPSTSAITSITAPVQYTQDVQGASIEGAIKDTRVYVLESDIASTTKKVNVVESEARF